MRRQSVFEMVHQVIADSQEKLEKTAAEETGNTAVGEQNKPEAPRKDETKEKDSSFESHLKIAAQCEFLASNFHMVEDARPPTEKLAELIATQEALLKSAEELHIPGPALGAYGAGGGQVPNEPNMTPGGNPFVGGDTGQATPANIPPTMTAPSEKPNPLDAPTAMPTNYDMMMPDQPENVLKQSSAKAEAILARFAQDGLIPAEKLASFKKKEALLGPIAAGLAGAHEAGEGNRARGTLYGLGGGALVGIPAATLGALVGVPLGPVGVAGGALVGQTVGGAIGGHLGGRLAREHAQEKKASGIPPAFAKVLMKKFAEDAIFPANIQSGSEPLLQRAPGVPPVQNQGSEAGELTPRETAPTTGQGAGRQFLDSVESAIGYTKRDAKAPQKAALSEVLTEPALSAAHDNVLQKSLDNASEAGVKISAARTLLKKIAASSPEAKRQLFAMIKAAEAGEPIPPPGQELAGAAHALAATPPPVSDEAMAAAAAGVTTDQLAMAQHMMAAQASESAAAAPPAPMASPEGVAGAAPAEAAPVQA